MRPRPGYPLGVTMLVTVPMMSTAQKTAIATNAPMKGTSILVERRYTGHCRRRRGSAPTQHDGQNHVREPAPAPTPRQQRLPAT